jgi:hypothetical protein
LVPADGLRDLDRLLELVFFDAGELLQQSGPARKRSGFAVRRGE